MFYHGTMNITLWVLRFRGLTRMTKWLDLCGTVLHILNLSFCPTNKFYCKIRCKLGLKRRKQMMMVYNWVRPVTGVWECLVLKLFLNIYSKAMGEKRVTQQLQRQCLSLGVPLKHPTDVPYLFLFWSGHPRCKKTLIRIESITLRQRFFRWNRGGRDF